MSDVIFRADKLGKKINEAKIRNNQLIDDLCPDNKHHHLGPDNKHHQLNPVQSPKFTNLY